jgi:hypothetical protein
MISGIIRLSIGSSKIPLSIVQGASLPVGLRVPQYPVDRLLP